MERGRGGCWCGWQPGQWGHRLQEAPGLLPQPHQPASAESCLPGSHWPPAHSACPQDSNTWKRDPFQESGLHLSPTAAEAKEKARATRVNKRAPQMDWNRKREIFSNF